jgi:hypothetical protein
MNRKRTEPEHIKSIVLQVMDDLAKGGGDYGGLHSSPVVCGPLTGPVSGLAKLGVNQAPSKAPGMETI